MGRKGRRIREKGRFLAGFEEVAHQEAFFRSRFRLPHVALFVHTYDVILRGMIQYLEGKRTPQGSLAT